MFPNAKYALYTSCIALIGLASAAQGIPVDRPILEPAQIKSHCIDEPYRSLPVGMVQFVKGQVTNNNGQKLEVRSNVAADEIVNVGTDSFVSLRLSDGSILNIQPETATSIACELQAPSAEFVISQPYLTGAIRG